jgi:hypothetical protein
VSFKKKVKEKNNGIEQFFESHCRFVAQNVSLIWTALTSMRYSHKPFTVCRFNKVCKINVTVFFCLVLHSVPITFPNQNFVCLSCFPAVWCFAKLANPENSHFSFAHPVTVFGPLLHVFPHAPFYITCIPDLNH